MISLVFHIAKIPMHTHTLLPSSFLPGYHNVDDHSVLDFLGEEASISVEQNLIIMELEQRAPVGDGEQGDVQLLGLVVQFRLHVHAHCAGALVQDGEEGPVVEESRHGHALLLPAGKDVCPVVD
jgi:hypothetical protein